jgi:hypothetical protein
MTGLEELVQAAMAAPDHRRAEALRILRGQAVAVDPRDGPPEPYLSLRQIARHLSISTCTLWRWRIPGHAFGGRPRYRLSEVRTYLEGEDFKRRLAILRAERKLSAKDASTRPTPRTATP